MKAKILYAPPCSEQLSVAEKTVICASKQLSNTIYFVDMGEKDYSNLWED